MSVFGKSYGKKITGQLFKDGKEVIFNNVSQAIKNGVAYVSEDRKEYGLILMDSVRDNLMIGNLDRRSEEHTSELQSRGHLVCRLLLEKKKYSYHKEDE